MDSINKNQPEENHEDLAGPAAVARMRELIKKAPTCFFCTSIKTGRQVETRPMSVQKVAEDGSIYFLSASDSAHNAEIAADSAVQLLFNGSGYTDFLTVYGVASISRDKAKIDELWEPILKTWFTDGKDDARITVIRVQPTSGYYWATKHNRAVVLAKMAIGALTGKTLDDSIEGRLRVQ